MRKGFQKKYLEKSKKQNVFSIKLNDQEMDWLMKGAEVIRQPKLSTALKQLAYIGYTKVVLDSETHAIIDYIFNNSRKNERLGIGDIGEELRKSNTFDEDS